MLTINDFKVENISAGCVTDEPQPGFSFSLESDRKGAALRKAQLSLNGWTAETDGQVGIRYEGEPLLPFTTYTALLKVWDDAGEEAEGEVSFETGRMGTAWKGVVECWEF